jgi:hypothetical protein
MFFLGAWFFFKRFPSDRSRGLILFSSLNLMWLIGTHNAFSPQYLSWIAPFWALWPGAGYAIIFIMIESLTTIIFPFHFRGLATVHPTEALLLNLRNGLFLAAMVSLFKHLLCRELKPTS